MKLCIPEVKLVSFATLLLFIVKEQFVNVISVKLYVKFTKVFVVLVVVH